jgi:putative ABC transport system permease protein
VSFAADLAERLRALLFRARQERELDEELRFHVERETAERVRHGAEPATARREALVAFGGLERTKDEVREARGIQTLHDLGSDVRYALHALGRNPAFTLTAVLVLGLGIGAATTVFSVVRSVLITDLPYPDAGQLVRIFEHNATTNIFPLSVVDTKAVHDLQTSFEAIGAASYHSAALSGAGAPERIDVTWAQAGYFRSLGIMAAAGRLIEPRDEDPAAPRVVVVSHTLAARSLGGDAAALGKSITLDGVSHTVVGVLPVGLEELAGRRADAWPVLRLQAPTRRGPFYLRVVARLKPGTSLDAAERDLAAISARIFPAWESSFHDRTATLAPYPLRQVIVGDADAQVGLFGAAVVLAFLIALANVATLMLVRASAREQELAVRAALGATRRRLARLLVTESLVVTALAGAAGLVLAALAVRALPSLAPTLPRVREVTLGAAGLLFAVLLAAASGVLIGVTPVASVLTRRAGPLHAGSVRTGANRRADAVRGALVTAEFALALPLLLGAGVLLNSLLRLQGVDPGYDATGVFAVSIALPNARYPDPPSVRRFLDLALLRAQETPGVTAAGFTTSLPPDNGGDVNNFDLPDHPVPAGGAQPVVPWSAVTPGFFAALKVPLVEGRLFTSGDTNDAPPVIVVSRAWAAHWFRGESAVGRRIISGGCTSCPPTTIVGVVGDVKYLGLASNGEGAYEPVAQALPTNVQLLVRGNAPPDDVFPRVRTAVAALDPELPLELETMSARLDRGLADPRRWTTLLAAFAATAALLAALGIFGLMSYVVRQRRREFGVRLALGAEPVAVTRLVLARGLRLAAWGIGAGVVLSFAGARWLRSLLFGVGPTDPATLALAALTLLGTAALACWVPGRRAARIRPLEAMASE